MQVPKGLNLRCSAYKTSLKCDQGDGRVERVKAGVWVQIPVPSLNQLHDLEQITYPL